MEAQASKIAHPGHASVTLFERGRDLVLYGRSWRTADDRGVSVRVFEPGSISLSEDASVDALDKRDDAALRRALRKSSRWYRESQFTGRFFIVMGVLMFAWHVSKTAGPFRWQSVAFDLMQAIAFMLLGVWLLRSLGNHPGPVRAELLKLGHCASCGYILREMPPDAQGLRRCPECSASWRIEACAAASSMRA